MDNTQQSASAGQPQTGGQPVGQDGLGGYSTNPPGGMVSQSPPVQPAGGSAPQFPPQQQPISPMSSLLPMNVAVPPSSMPAQSAPMPSPAPAAPSGAIAFDIPVVSQQPPQPVSPIMPGSGAGHAGSMESLRAEPLDIAPPALSNSEPIQAPVYEISEIPIQMPTATQSTVGSFVPPSHPMTPQSQYQPQPVMPPIINGGLSGDGDFGDDDYYGQAGTTQGSGGTTQEDTTPANFQLGAKLPPYLKLKIPSHTLAFDEQLFLHLLAGSISLTKEEKKRIVQSVPKLKQSQIDELIRIFEEEREKFAELSQKHVPQLEKLSEKQFQDWMDLETEQDQVDKAANDEKKAEDIRKNLGI